MPFYGGPPYLQTQQTILETQHNIFETQVDETQNKIIETRHKIIETTQLSQNYHKVIETNINLCQTLCYGVSRPVSCPYKDLNSDFGCS